jgi:hypothetical protein
MIPVALNLVQATWRNAFPPAALKVKFFCVTTYIQKLPNLMLREQDSSQFIHDDYIY